MPSFNLRRADLSAALSLAGKLGAKRGASITLAYDPESDLRRLTLSAVAPMGEAYGGIEVALPTPDHEAGPGAEPHRIVVALDDLRDIAKGGKGAPDMMRLGWAGPGNDDASRSHASIYTEDGNGNGRVRRVGIWADREGVTFDGPDLIAGGVTFDGPTLAWAIGRVGWATDEESTRFTLGGVKMEADCIGHPASFKLVATDGRTLASQTIPTTSAAMVSDGPGGHWAEDWTCSPDPDGADSVIPLPFLTALASVAKSADETDPVRMAFRLPRSGDGPGETQPGEVVATVGAVRLWARCLSGRFPRYADCFPTSADHDGMIPVGADMADTFRGAIAHTDPDRTGSVSSCLTVGADRYSVTCAHRYHGSGSATIRGILATSHYWRVNLDPRYMADLIGHAIAPRPMPIPAVAPGRKRPTKAPAVAPVAMLTIAQRSDPVRLTTDDGFDGLVMPINNDSTRPDDWETLSADDRRAWFGVKPLDPSAPSPTDPIPLPAESAEVVPTHGPISYMHGQRPAEVVPTPTAEVVRPTSRIADDDIPIRSPRAIADMLDMARHASARSSYLYGQGNPADAESGERYRLQCAAFRALALGATIRDAVDVMRRTWYQACDERRTRDGNRSTLHPDSIDGGLSHVRRMALDAIARHGNDPDPDPTPDGDGPDGATADDLRPDTERYQIRSGSLTGDEAAPDSVGSSAEVVNLDPTGQRTVVGTTDGPVRGGVVHYRGTRFVVGPTGWGGWRPLIVDDGAPRRETADSLRPDPDPTSDPIGEDSVPSAPVSNGTTPPDAGAEVVAIGARYAIIGPAGSVPIPTAEVAYPDPSKKLADPIRDRGRATTSAEVSRAMVRAIVGARTTLELFGADDSDGKLRTLTGRRSPRVRAALAWRTAVRLTRQRYQRGPEGTGWGGSDRTDAQYRDRITRVLGMRRSLIADWGDTVSAVAEACSRRTDPTPPTPPDAGAEVVRDDSGAPPRFDIRADGTSPQLTDSPSAGSDRIGVGAEDTPAIPPCQDCQSRQMAEKGAPRHRTADSVIPPPIDRGQRGAPSASAPCLTILIGGKAYGLTVSVVGREYVIDSPDGASYRVGVRPDRGFAPECSCPSAVYRHNGLDSVGCKHAMALRFAGLIPDPIGWGGPDRTSDAGAEVVAIGAEVVGAEVVGAEVGSDMIETRGRAPAGAGAGGRAGAPGGARAPVHACTGGRGGAAPGGAGAGAGAGAPGAAGACVRGSEGDDLPPARVFGEGSGAEQAGSDAGDRPGLIAENLSPLARATVREVKAGDRVYWDGDTANLPHDGTVLSVDRDRWGVNVRIRWDDAKPSDRDCIVPPAILHGPRWGWIDDREADRARKLAEVYAKYAAVIADTPLSPVAGAAEDTPARVFGEGIDPADDDTAQERASDEAVAAHDEATDFDPCNPSDEEMEAMGREEFDPDNGDEAGDLPATDPEAGIDWLSVRDALDTMDWDRCLPDGSMLPEGREGRFVEVVAGPMDDETTGRMASAAGRAGLLAMLDPNGNLYVGTYRDMTPERVFGETISAPRDDSDTTNEEATTMATTYTDGQIFDALAAGSEEFERDNPPARTSRVARGAATARLSAAETTTPVVDGDGRSYRCGFWSNAPAMGAAIATVLNETTDSEPNDWEVAPPEDDNERAARVILRRASDHDCKLVIYPQSKGNKVRYHVGGRYVRDDKGNYYPHYRDQPDSIGFDPAKTAGKIARDIVKRFLPAYLSAYRDGRRQYQETTSYEDRRAKLARDMAETIGHGCTVGRDGSFGNHRSGAVYFYGSEANGDGTVDLKMHNVPADLARRIVAMVNESA